MKNRVRLVAPFLAVMLTAALFVTGPGRGEAANVPRYLAFELGTLGGDNSVARGINNRRQIVGDADVNTARGISHAFLWEHGGMTDLGTFGGDTSVALGINNAGQVVGSATVPPGSGPGHAFLWTKGRLQDIHPNAAIASSATAINNRGQVVGFYLAQNGTEHAALWNDGRMMDLGIPSNPVSRALGINESGQIVGHYRPDPNTLCAFLWERGKLTTIGQCQAGAGQSFAFGVNNRGQVVGVAPLSFLYQRGILTPINLLVARAINEGGDIAGACTSASGVVHGCIWDRGIVVDIDHGSSQPRDSDAFAINDQSDLAGFAHENNRNRAVLWSRIP